MKVGELIQRIRERSMPVLAWLDGMDLVLLLSSLLVVGGALAFLGLADEVSEGDTHSIDERIVLALRDPGNLGDPIGPPWFEEAVRDITGLGGVTILGLVIAAVAGFLLIRRKYHAMWLVLAAAIGGQLLSSFLKGYFDRPRPEVVPQLMHAATSSFPSGHSLMSAVVYLTLGVLLARLTRDLRLKVYFLGVALSLTLLVGVSRVYLGVHYPTDVLAGWALGLAWAVLCWVVARSLQRRGMVESSAEEP